MKTIWKFEVALVSPQQVPMPNGTEILTVQTQGETGCLWALVDTEADSTDMRTFEVFGTGQIIHEDMGIERKYIGTFQVRPFVWHVFERLS
jgi:hypothetical protein